MLYMYMYVTLYLTKNKASMSMPMHISMYMPLSMFIHKSFLEVFLIEIIKEKESTDDKQVSKVTIIQRLHQYRLQTIFLHEVV